MERECNTKEIGKRWEREGRGLQAGRRIRTEGKWGRNWKVLEKDWDGNRV